MFLKIISGKEIKKKLQFLIIVKHADSITLFINVIFFLKKIVDVFIINYNGSGENINSQKNGKCLHKTDLFVQDGGREYMEKSAREKIWAALWFVASI